MEKKNHLNIFNASNKKEYCNKMEKMKKKNVKIKINIFIEMIYIYIYEKYNNFRKYKHNICCI